MPVKAFGSVGAAPISATGEAWWSGAPRELSGGRAQSRDQVALHSPTRRDLFLLYWLSGSGGKAAHKQANALKSVELFS